MPEYIHYSKEPVKTVRSVDQSDGPAMKPEGFWLSVEDGDGWKDWCEGNDFGGDRFAHSHEVVLAEDANILHLDTPAAVLDFGTKYKTELPPFLGIREYYINWPEIALHWQGIVIAPYQWSIRMDEQCLWYYGWDCSSGCIWDAAAIASITEKGQDDARVHLQRNPDAARR